MHRTSRHHNYTMDLVGSSFASQVKFAGGGWQTGNCITILLKQDEYQNMKHGIHTFKLPATGLLL